LVWLFAVFYKERLLMKKTTVHPALSILFAAALMLGASAHAGNHAPNPYRTIEGWGKLPEGRVWGATSAIYPAKDGKHIWVAERCGANSCVDSDLDPVLLFDQEGNLIRSFGAGMFAWPHGLGRGCGWICAGARWLGSRDLQVQPRGRGLDDPRDKGRGGLW
jgi:hypothetical protein